MSDLTPDRCDRGGPESPRKSARLAAGRDRPAIGRDRRPWLLGLALLWGCVRAAPGPIAPPAAPRVALWVDAHALDGGDGTRARPLKRLPAALPDGVELHLATGLYEGPFHLPSGARVWGHGQVVLHAAWPAVVVGGHDVTLVHVSVQGGDVGARLTGKGRLEDVHVSGHRAVGVDVGAGATLEADALHVEGTIPGALGVRGVGAALRLSRLSFQGDLRQGLRVEGGAVHLVDGRSEGGRTLLHALGAAVTLERGKATGGTGPAVFLSAGSATVRDLEVDGHEVALHATSGARLDVRGLSSVRAHYGGVVLHGGAAGTLAQLSVSGSGPGGGVQALGADVTLEDVAVRRTGGLGVLVRQGKARLRRVVVEQLDADVDLDGSRSLGDALMLRDATVDADDVSVRDVEGSALYASAYARVTVGALSCERCGGGMALVERGAQVKARRLVAKGTLGPAVSVPDQARLEVEQLVVSGGAEVPVYAGCAAGAVVVVEVLESALVQPALPCVTVRAQTAGAR